MTGPRVTDAWGIDRKFQDALGRWHDTPAETREAILASMHADPEVPPPEASVLLVHPGGRVCVVSPGELTVETGETVRVLRELPPDLPFGYHELRSEADGNTSHIICTPGECYLPEQLQTWGWALQLYALRSRDSWGIGDLADLQRFARWSADELRAGVVMINPLSAPAPTPLQQPSPYFPSSRRYRNPLFLRIEDIPGARELAVDLEPLANAGRALNKQRLIDRNGVFLLKMEALGLLWKQFRPDGGFEEFCRREGAGLHLFATYCALAEVHGKGWRDWPSEHRHPDAPGVRTFASSAPDRIQFHKWVQWLIDVQLRAASDSLGLMQDLPIGVDPSGADAWIWQDLFADGVAIGVPPDEFNTLGQNWGLPPFIPHKLREEGYKPLVQTVRSVLRHAGGLRIDHVIGLFRLFWIPNGADASRGAYVRYRADEILAIIAIESQRARAIVVGEDLGGLEGGVHEMLELHKVLSYRLLWFEKEKPAKYPKKALAAVTTHDLPTIAGLWSGSDLAAQKRLGLKPNEEGLKEQLHRLQSMLPRAVDSDISEVIVETHKLLGEAPSHVLTASLDDVLAVEERPNMPQTIDEWPNWCIALPKSLEEIEQDPITRRVGRALERRPA